MIIDAVAPRSEQAIPAVVQNGLSDVDEELAHCEDHQPVRNEQMSTIAGGVGSELLAPEGDSLDCISEESYASPQTAGGIDAHALVAGELHRDRKSDVKGKSG